MADVWKAFLAGIFGAIIFPLVKERLARPQWAVVTALRFAGRPLSPRDLHSELQGSFGPATVNRVLVKLERKGLVISKRGGDSVQFELSPGLRGLQRRRGRRILVWALIGFVVLFLLAMTLVVIPPTPT
jgi:hypothetical protein